MDYDLTKIPEVYDRGRYHGPVFLEKWMTVVTDRVDPSTVRDILDLGCGTGRFSQALSERFDATVVAIDPSTKMLRQAFNNASGNNGVVYANSFAEAIPLQANSIDLVFISMSFHHFCDPRVAIQECRRVLRTGGRVCLRTGSREQISMYPYVRFFPISRGLLELHLPSVTFVREMFEAAPFQILSHEVVTQQIAASLSDYADKISVRADSILASLDDKDFEAGLQALRSEAAVATPHPVTEPIDFFVFGKS